MKKKTVLFFYVFGAYVVLQFAWWGYHLIELTKEIGTQQATVSKRVFMIISEGSVFFLLLILGLWKIRSSMKKELKFTQRQNNFLLSVTHELKTPLAANKLYLQTVLKRDLDAAKRIELIQKAIAENVRLEGMVDHILTASRIENNVVQVHKESIDLSKLLAEIVQGFNKSFQYDLLELDGVSEVHIVADEFMIKTCVNNLIENAIKYAGTEKKVTVYLKRTTGDHIIFGVKDQGPGIKPEFVSEIFQKFVRSGNEETRSQKGTGLGLFIVSEFIRIHGGKIAYKNNETFGANFEITL
jgi:two-component system, OmpR family, phosphate regulon sensor histidine kinase PhoR